MVLALPWQPVLSAVLVLSWDVVVLASIPALAGVPVLALAGVSVLAQVPCSVPGTRPEGRWSLLLPLEVLERCLARSLAVSRVPCPDP